MNRVLANIPLFKKLTIAFLLCGLIPVVITSAISLHASKESLTEEAFGKLELVREIKERAISDYIGRVQNQIATMSQSPSIMQAMLTFSRTFKIVEAREKLEESEYQQLKSELLQFYRDEFAVKYEKENDGKAVDVNALFYSLDKDTIILQSLYIARNSNKLGEKHLLQKGDGKSVYHMSHNHYHPDIRTFLEKFGYYDIFLVDIETGDIVYSVYKELDFATSLNDGPYADTSFARAYQRAKTLPEGEFAIEDFDSYTPSYEAPASFVASPIYNLGKPIGVLVFQIPLKPVNAIMSQRSGMGETGESYLIGSDKLMRSDSQLHPEHHTVKTSFQNPELGRVDTFAATEALSGNEGNSIITTYTGKEVFSAYKPVHLNGLQWAIIAEKDKDEALAPVTKLRNKVLFAVALCVVFIFVFALSFSKAISSPILKLSKIIQLVSRQGDFNRSVPVPGKDEIGDTCIAFNGLLRSTSAAIQSTNETLNALAEGDTSKSVVGDYSGQLRELVDGVNHAIVKVKQANINAQEKSHLAEQKALEADKAASEAKTQADAALVVKQALDVSATPVLITDEKFSIVYENDAAMALLKKRESDIRKEIPQFNASNVLGEYIDLFYSDAAEKKQMFRNLRETHRENMHIAHLTIMVDATPIRDNNGGFLGVVLEWIDRTEEIEKQKQQAKITEENQRIRQALDNSSTATMLVDGDLNVLYENSEFHQLVTRYQADFSASFGGDFTNHLVGKNISKVMQHPLLSVQTVQSVNVTKIDPINIGTGSFLLATTPVLNDVGERIGTVFEWQDETAERATQVEIDTSIDSASRGDFNVVLNGDGKEGFFKSVSLSLNRLLENMNVAVGDVVQVFSALSNGDLTKKIDREYEGDFRQLKNYANSTVEKLRETLSEIAEVSSTIASSAAEIASGNESLGRRTEQQAATLEQASANMENMTQKVKDSAENANNVTVLVERSVDIARSGNASIERTSAVMKEISQSSREVSNIISLIDDIAFQTNLLALNAAVEAARAGEQGRGFAVVAGEVRNLAQRSADAARTIKGLIDKSTERVDEGILRVNDTDQNFKEIVQQIESVSEKIQEILVGANEQADGIGEINTAIGHMDSMTQENAAMVEQVVASSQVMSDQSQKLDRLMSFFKQG